MTWKTFVYMAVFVFALTTTASLQAEEAKPHERIEKLGLSCLKGEVPVFYSEGFEERALYFQELIGPALKYFQKPEILGVEVPMQLAVLGPEDWASFTKLPYGVDHILPEPPTAILAASGKGNIITMGIIAGKEHQQEKTLKKIEKLGFSYQDAALSFADLIGLHEMGHILADHYGSHPWPETKWLCEFVATYLAYAYLKENQPKLAELWETMSTAIVSNPGVKHTTIADFEELYIGVGNESYAWYQGKFNMKVFEVYSKVGITFMHNLKKSLAENPEVSPDDPFRLKEMDTICEGFNTWTNGPEGDLK